MSCIDGKLLGTEWLICIHCAVQDASFLRSVVVVLTMELPVAKANVAAARVPTPSMTLQTVHR